MYCRNCGKEVEEGEKFCVYCGNPLQKNSSSNRGRKKNKKKLGIVAGIVAVVILVIMVLPETTDSDKIIGKLLQFTSAYQNESGYVFDYNGIWDITYADVNEFIKCQNYAVYDCLSDFLGATSFGNYGEFTYDLDEKEFRIYVDYETIDGNLSIINYDIGKDKLTVMVDGERYTASDEMEEYINTSGIIDSMKKTIEEIQSVLKSNGLTLEQIASLKYKDIVTYMN